MKYLLPLLFSLVAMALPAQKLPAPGRSDRLEIGNWNVEWFGDTSNGPSNESLQLANVAAVLRASDIDIWGLCEVSSQKAWDSLLLLLPEYAGVKATWSQIQKTALLFKKNQFSLILSHYILSSYYAAFASGRLPLEVKLSYQHQSHTDTLFLYVVHLKSNVGTNTEKQSAWQERKDACSALKGYLDTFGNGKLWAVIGDWNDDLDTSVLAGYGTPFKSMLQNPAYFFPTQKLTQAGLHSTLSYPHVIDHQCISPQLRHNFVTDSCGILRVDTMVKSYGSTTSDHLPVYSMYHFGNPASTSHYQPPASVFVYWNGNQIVTISKGRKPQQISLFSLTGILLFQGENTDNYAPVSGCYEVLITFDGGRSQTQKLLIP